MSPRLLSNRRSSFFRRIFVGICVVAHLVTTTGFPLPRGGEIEAGTAPYPCQHHHCGCRSAEHCWRSCCCMSTQEKLAWAKQNGVTPPDYVLAAAISETQEHEAHDCADAGDEVPSCCAAKRSPARRSCCSSVAVKECGASQHCHGEGDNTSKRSAPGIDWILGIQAQKCQGVSTLWIISGAVLPPSPPQSVTVDAAPPLWWSHTMVCVWQTISQQPDVPPPRLV